MDRSIVEAARSGDRHVFDALVRAEVDGVYRLALAITGSEADAADATQDAFLAAWRSLPDLRDVDRFDAWLGRIAVNAARMQLRGRRRRQVREATVEDLDGTAQAGRQPRNRAGEDAIALAAALGRLGESQRTLLALRHVQGRSVEEIAAILAIPGGTVKSRLHTARRALAAALAEEASDG